MTPPRFPGAPEGSYVCEEGWLIIGDEAWSADEWATDQGRAYRSTAERSRRSRLAASPEAKARQAERVREWQQRHPERVAENKRRYRVKRREAA